MQNCDIHNFQAEELLNDVLIKLLTSLKTQSDSY